MRGLQRRFDGGRSARRDQGRDGFGLRLQHGRDYDVVNVEHDDRYRDYWQTYLRMTERKGVTQQLAKIEMRRRLTLISTMLLHNLTAISNSFGEVGGRDLLAATRDLFADRFQGGKEAARIMAASGRITPWSAR